MKKFKVGDVVFCTQDYPLCSQVRSGDIGVICGGEKSNNPLVETDRGGGDNSWWIPAKHLEIYNKKNWCRVFLEMMNESR